jgi:dTMP kinase
MRGGAGGHPINRQRRPQHRAGVRVGVDAGERPRGIRVDGGPHGVGRVVWRVGGGHAAIVGRYGPAVARGRLITIEGLDGAGKTTLAEGLARELAEHGRERGGTVQLLREPGGVHLSERLRELVKDPALTVGGRAEALLYAAARAQLVQERLEPLLDGGALVLLDRFVDSSLAYQGAGRKLGVEEVRTVNLFATGGLQPDRTLLLHVSPGAARVRQDARAVAPDRLEREGEEFFARIAAAYEQLARAEPRRIRPLDAEQPPELVLRDALAAIEDLL